MLKRIIRIRDKLILLNEPTITEKDPGKVLSDIRKDIKGIKIYDIDGKKIDLITRTEKLNLKIQK